MPSGYFIAARAREILRDRGWGGLVHHASRSVVRNWQAWRFQPYTTHNQIAGENLTLRIADQFGEGWYATKREWKELTWVRDHLIRPGGTAVDVGTNHGVTAVLFAKWVGFTGHVIAIDGRSQNLDTARRNGELNQAPNIQFVHAAVGSRNGTIEFMDQPNGAVLMRPGSSRKTVTVPLRTLDDIVGHTPVSFLKIDVEGHELEVLKGSVKVLEGAPNLDLEIHCSEFADPARAVRDILDCIGARRYELHWQLSFDGVPVMDAADTSPECVAQHANIHLFAKRLAP